jgi:mRNA interferase HigB
MRVISVKKLKDFWDINPRAEQPLRSWYHEARNGKWLTPDDVKEKFGSADIVANNRIIFNIGGNKYRLVVQIAYKIGCVYVRFIGTHREYDKIDAEVI